jgi:hypothetical protein
MIRRHPFPHNWTAHSCIQNFYIDPRCFCRAVSDNERIQQKIFHAEIVVDNDKVAAETEYYQKIPEILSFVNEAGEDMMKQEIEANYRQIKLILIRLLKLNWSVLK